MAIFKCKMCGAPLEVDPNAPIIECEWCGITQTKPNLNDDRRANLYDRANHFRRANEFDKAEAIYEQILNEDTTDAEAYWSLVLCRFGIEYVEDPATKKRMPTVNRTQHTSIFDDANYKSALEHADANQKKIYEEEARTINEIQKGILAISEKEEPFDIFICYKESDAEGKRTPDSVLANDLYYQLTQEGFKVFYAAITLEDKLGVAYEPYIFAALNSSKVMVVLGTKPEYFKAVWVKNEWSRYLHLIKNGEKKYLIPAFKDFDPYDLPEEFSHLQAQDMSRLGFVQDLIRGIKKLIVPEKTETAAAPAAATQNAAAGGIAPLLKRAQLFLEDRDWASANEYSEKVLDIDPECAEAYLSKLCAELHVPNTASLKNQKDPFDHEPNCIKALRYAKPQLKDEINGILDFIKNRNEIARQQKIYDEGEDLFAKAVSEADYQSAANRFGRIPEFKDAAERKEDCLRRAEIARKEAIYDKAKRSYESGNPRSILASKDAFRSIPGYKDADRLAENVEDKADTARKMQLCTEARAVLNRKSDAITIQRAIYDMSLISDFAEANELEQRLKTKKHEVEEEERKKKEDEDRKARERIAHARRKGRADLIGRWLKFGVIMAIILGIVGAAYYFFYKKPNDQYILALSYLEEGEYDQAIEIFEGLNRFKDSKGKWMESKAGKASVLAEEGNLTDAYQIFDDINRTYNEDMKDKDKEKFVDTFKLCNYKYGETLLLGEETEKAAVRFGTAIGYEDAKERSFALWNSFALRDRLALGIRTSAVLNEYEGIAIINADGTISASHGNEDFMRQISEWKNIVDVVAFNDFLLALDNEGKVHCAGYYNTLSDVRYTEAENLVDLDKWDDAIVALCADGRVIRFYEDGTFYETGMTDIVQVSVGGDHYAGLTFDGTVVAQTTNSYNTGAIENVSTWTDVVQVRASGNWIYAIKKDGTILTNNTNNSTRENMAQWKDIVNLDCANEIWGLTSDGRLTCTSSNQNDEWLAWTGIEELYARGSMVVAVDGEGKLYGFRTDMEKYNGFSFTW